ncbi:hypothetical protein QKW52_10635 [Bacillus sonorensis]|nr:hypothetical protein [Bacillus sonorensis]
MRLRCSIGVTLRTAICFRHRFVLCRRTGRRRFRLAAFSGNSSYNERFRRRRPEPWQSIYASIDLKNCGRCSLCASSISSSICLAILSDGTSGLIVIATRAVL